MREAAEYRCEAYAKINLTLDITGRRADGYHELRSVMQTIGLCDSLWVRPLERGIHIEISCEEDEGRGFSLVPTGADNLACRAAERLLRDAGCDRGVAIRLHKRIPVAAGLAGGSTDAAAVLKLVNALYGLGYTTEQLCALGAGLGADIPFCIRGGTVLCEGIGDRMTPLPALTGIPLLLAKPQLSVSTAAAYRAYDERQARGELPVVDTDGMVARIRTGEVTARSLAGSTGNVLAAVTEREYPQIAQLRERLMETGAAAAMMSGSGPSVFALYEDEAQARSAREQLLQELTDVYLAVTELCPETGTPYTESQGA